MLPKSKVKPKKVEVEQVVEKVVETVADLDGLAKALARLYAGKGADCKRQAVQMAKMAVFKIENKEKRELTTDEASAFVRSGYTN